jgi:hypothetical protein
MPRLTRLVATAATTSLTILALTSCGGSDSLVHFDGAPHASISKATLNHWMQSMVGGDFRRSIATEGPQGLASEPANYPSCVAAAKLVAPRSFYNQLRFSRAQLTEKCHQLYRSIKTQALSFLISAQWTIAEAAEQHITATDADVRHAVALARKQAYPTERDLHKYLTDRHWSLADLLYQVKLTVLVSRLLPRFEQQVKKAGGGERVYAKLALEHYGDIVAKTSCSKGYVVPGCKEFRDPLTLSPPPPDVIIKKLTGKQPS